MAKRALVAGGAGFIGSHMCEELLNRGHRVLCVDNLITGTLDNVEMFGEHPRFEFTEADVADGIQINAEPLDYVFNLACPASPADFDPLAIEILDVCSNGTHRLLDLARERGAVFLQASTSEVYGEPEIHPQTEDYWGHVNPTGERSCYDEGKRYAEALIMAYHRKHDLDVRIARIFNTYGPRMRIDDGRVVPNFICQALSGQPLTIYGDGSQTRSFCYVTDTVSGLLGLAEASPERIDRNRPAYNIGNGDEISVMRFAEEVVRVCGGASDFRMVPLPQEDDPSRRQPDTSKLRELTGWRSSTSLRAGLHATVEWFREAMKQQRVSQVSATSSV